MWSPHLLLFTLTMASAWGQTTTPSISPWDPASCAAAVMANHGLSLDEHLDALKRHRFGALVSPQDAQLWMVRVEAVRRSPPEVDVSMMDLRLPEKIRTRTIHGDEISHLYLNPFAREAFARLQEVRRDVIIRRENIPAVPAGIDLGPAPEPPSAGLSALYATANKKGSRTATPPLGFGYHRPNSPIATPAQPSLTLSIPSTSNPIDLVRLRLTAALGVDPKRASFLGEGLSFRVYLLPRTSRGNHVAKLLNDSPYLIGSMHRHRALTPLAEALFGRMTFDGHPFVRVARTASGEDLHRQGIVVQEYIPGPSVADLYRAIHAALDQPGRLNQEQRDILRQAKLDPRDRSALERMKRRIRALESAYIESHADVVGYIWDQQIIGLQNMPNGGSNPAIVGFDYNHGNNVIWSPDEQMFVVIDL